MDDSRSSRGLWRRHWQKLVAAACLLAPLLSPREVAAYPAYIGFGYSTCVTCHFNPLGSGPLTDYGRALAAGTIAAKPFYSSSKRTDDDLVASSGFFGPFGSGPDWLRLQAGYRGLYYTTGIESQASSRLIHMQLEGSMRVEVLKERLSLSGTAGYYPPNPAAAAAGTPPRSSFISREYYADIKLFEWLDIQAGLLETAFGLRIPDHNAFIRSRTELDQDNQTQGAVLHLSGEKWDGAVHGFIGNPTDAATARQSGYSIFLERSFGEKTRLGASFLSAKSDLLDRRLYALHARAGFGEGSAILAQVTAIQGGLIGQPTRTGDAVFFQGMTRLARGAYLLMTIEQTTTDLSMPATRLYRAGPAIQLFPLQRVELRLDFLATRATGVSTTSVDSLSTLAQLHVWF